MQSRLGCSQQTTFLNIFLAYKIGEYGRSDNVCRSQSYRLQVVARRFRIWFLCTDMLFITARL